MHQINQLSQQSVMNSSLYSLRHSFHSPLHKSDNSTYNLRYHFDVNEDGHSSQSAVTIVLTLSGDKEQELREFIKLFRDSELSSITIRLCLRFHGEPSRRILNFCKLNCPTVDVFNCNEHVLEFIQKRAPLFLPTSNRTDTMEYYVLSFDFGNLPHGPLFDLLLKHTVQEWRYCTQLLQEDPNALRAVGLFPTLRSATDGGDFLFNCFWLRIASASPFMPLKPREKMETLLCSKSTWFSSEADVEGASFTYDTSPSRSFSLTHTDVPSEGTESEEEEVSVKEEDLEEETNVSSSLDETAPVPTKDIKLVIISNTPSAVSTEIPYLP